MKKLLISLLLVVTAASTPGPADAQGASGAFPNRAIKFVVSFPPGGGNDLMARLVAQVVSERVGQPVLVENRAGAAGVVGSASVANSPPDGYTVLVTGDVPITQSHLLGKVPYDPVKDLAPLVKGAIVPTAVLVAGDSRFKTLQEVIDFARGNPGKVSYGTPGTGTSSHAELEMLKEAFGVDIAHIPYKGAAPIITDTIGGAITVGAPGLPPAIGNLKSGKLRMLALWSIARSAAFPDVPTVREATGKAALEGLMTWYGFLLPRGVPPDIAARLEREIIAALRSPDVMRKLSEVGATVSAQPAVEFEVANRAQTEYFAALFKKLNLKAE